MIRETVIYALLLALLWCLHGIDVQYYAMSSPVMFEWQIYMSVIIIFSLAVINSIDLKVFRHGKMA